MSLLELEIGERVHYGAHGVCIVTGTETKALGGTKRDYYVMHPMGKETIHLYLPVDADGEKVKLRRLLRPEQITELIQAARQPEPWISDSKMRREKWNKILRGGDVAELLSLMWQIHSHEKTLPDGKQLPMSDQEILRMAEKQIYGEFSCVLGLKEEEVLPFILKQAGENF